MARQYFLILCFATRVWPETTEYDANDFGEYVKVNKIDADQFTKIVTVGRYPEPSGILFTPDNPAEDNAVHATYDLYAAASCEIARWTMNKIFHFLKRTPLYYQNNFDKHRVYERTFGHKFADLLKSLAEIDPYVERAINVLHGFAKNHPMYTYYSDSTLVKSLVSIRLKIHFASPCGWTTDGGRFEYAKLTDARVVRLFAEELNALQRFLSTNCSAEPSDGAGRHSEFVGHWITEIDVARTSPDTIDGLLFNIRPLKLESDGPDKCFATQMLLEKFASTSLDDAVSQDIMQAQFEIPGIKQIPLINILLRLTEVYDADLFFLYQKCVITALVKSLFYRTLKLIQTNPGSVNIMRLVDHINAKISENIEHFPKLFVDCFRILNEYLILNGDVDKRHHRGFIDSLLIVNIDISEKPLPPSPEDDIVESLTPNENDLRNILAKINVNIDDFKCFHRSTMIRHIDHNKYNKTFTEIVQIYFIEPPVNDRIYNLCGFTLKTYSVCYQGVIYVNRCIEKKELFQKIKLFQRVMKEFNKVRSYFLTFIKMEIKDLILRKMAFEVAIIMFKNHFNYDRIHYVKRIFNVVMTELNIFGTKYCESSNYKNLLINNCDLMNLGNVHSVDEFMIKYFQKADSSYDVNWPSMNILRNYFNNIDIDFIYNTYIHKSKVFNFYEEIIIFCWKGRMLSVKQIYQNTTVFTINSYDLHALYDIYFKFFIAVIFYETRLLLLTEKTNEIEVITSTFQKMINQLTCFVANYFPKNLRSLIEDITALWYVPWTQIKMGKSVNSRLQLNVYITNSPENIERQFTKFGIVFKKPKTFYRGIGNLKETFTFSKYKFDIINSEIEKNVNSVFDRFISLQMMLLHF